VQHTLVVLVEDKPGVLNRVASLFRRRAFNIESLTVGHTETAGISRMTIVVVDGEQVSVERLTSYLYKLVNVIQVEDLTGKPMVSRDLALIKISTESSNRPEIIQMADVFRARVVDMTATPLMIEVTGDEQKVDGLVEVLQPLGIIEMVRTGARPSFSTLFPMQRKKPCGRPSNLGSGRVPRCTSRTASQLSIATRPASFRPKMLT
jgi:acetolactate synthase-1/3 small subunit